MVSLTNAPPSGNVLRISNNNTTATRSIRADAAKGGREACATMTFPNPVLESPSQVYDPNSLQSGGSLNSASNSVFPGIYLVRQRIVKRTSNICGIQNREANYLQQNFSHPTKGGNVRYQQATSIVGIAATTVDQNRVLTSTPTNRTNPGHIRPNIIPSNTPRSYATMGNWSYPIPTTVASRTVSHLQHNLSSTSANHSLSSIKTTGRNIAGLSADTILSTSSDTVRTSVVSTPSGFSESAPINPAFNAVHQSTRTGTGYRKPRFSALLKGQCVSQDSRTHDTTSKELFLHGIHGITHHTVAAALSQQNIVINGSRNVSNAPFSDNTSYPPGKQRLNNLPGDMIMMPHAIGCRIGKANPTQISANGTVLASLTVPCPSLPKSRDFPGVSSKTNVVTLESSDSKKDFEQTDEANQTRSTGIDTPFVTISPRKNSVPPVPIQRGVELEHGNSVLVNKSQCTPLMSTAKQTTITERQAGTVDAQWRYESLPLGLTGVFTKTKAINEKEITSATGNGSAQLNSITPSNRNTASHEPSNCSPQAPSTSPYTTVNSLPIRKSTLNRISSDRPTISEDGENSETSSLRIPGRSLDTNHNDEKDTSSRILNAENQDPGDDHVPTFCYTLESMKAVKEKQTTSQTPNKNLKLGYEKSMNTISNTLPSSFPRFQDSRCKTPEITETRRHALVHSQLETSFDKEKNSNNVEEKEALSESDEDLPRFYDKESLIRVKREADLKYPAFDMDSTGVVVQPECSKNTATTAESMNVAAHLSPPPLQPDSPIARKRRTYRRIKQPTVAESDDDELGSDISAADSQINRRRRKRRRVEPSRSSESDQSEVDLGPIQIRSSGPESMNNIGSSNNHHPMASGNDLGLEISSLGLRFDESNEKLCESDSDLYSVTCAMSPQSLSCARNCRVVITKVEHEFPSLVKSLFSGEGNQKQNTGSTSDSSPDHASSEGTFDETFPEKSADDSNDFHNDNSLPVDNAQEVELHDDNYSVLKETIEDDNVSLGNTLHNRRDFVNPATDESSVSENESLSSSFTSSDTGAVYPKSGFPDDGDWPFSDDQTSANSCEEEIDGSKTGACSGYEDCFPGGAYDVVAMGKERNIFETFNKDMDDYSKYHRTTEALEIHLTRSLKMKNRLPHKTKQRRRMKRLFGQSDVIQSIIGVDSKASPKTNEDASRNNENADTSFGHEHPNELHGSARTRGDGNATKSL